MRTWTRRVAAVGGGVLVVGAAVLGLSPGGGPDADAEPKRVVIDLDAAVSAALPALAEDLKPARFQTADGRRGWALKIPGGLPIATPAYADGVLFVGGGYGSHEFYAFDAATGEVRWKLATQDDGPTAAVVEDGRVAFNTESCTVIVADAKTGKVVWQEWLGDPLMSQPAISRGRLFIAYPASRGDGKHRMLCADLETGKHLWEREISGDVITAPVVDGERLYFTCFDGTGFCMETKDGAEVWRRAGSGTSAPAVDAGRLVVTRKQVQGQRTREGIETLEAGGGTSSDRELLHASDARYLEADRGGGVALAPGVVKQLDASVGFAAAPSGAKLSEANANVGVATVAGAWAFQGSRASRAGSMWVNAQGRSINGLDDSARRSLWSATAVGAGVTDDSQVFSPPAVGGSSLYLVTGQGHIVSVGREDGAVRFLYATKQPIAFQPALAKGNLYAGTANGLLICLETGDPQADGWYAWGGNAQHNKK